MKAYVYIHFFETNLMYPYFLGIVFLHQTVEGNTLFLKQRVFSVHLFVRCYLNTARQIFKPMCKLRFSFKYREKKSVD